MMAAMLERDEFARRLDRALCVAMERRESKRERHREFGRRVETKLGRLSAGTEPAGEMGWSEAGTD